MEIQKGMYGLPQAVILQTNYLKNVWRNTDTSNNPTRQALGSMAVLSSGSTYVCMILESNVLDTSTFNIYTMRYGRKHMKILKMLKVTSIAALP